mgnify:CR=1 FL=1
MRGRTDIVEPGRSAEVVDVSAADQDLTAGAASLYVGICPAATGDVSVRLVGTGDAVVLTVVPGTLLPAVVDKVYKVGTTATGIVALYD